MVAGLSGRRPPTTRGSACSRDRSTRASRAARHGDVRAVANRRRSRTPTTARSTATDARVGREPRDPRGHVAGIGTFDESAPTGAGDEEEWEERHLAAGGRIRYVAAAALDHRRSAADSRVHALAIAAARRGASARRYDERRGVAPPLRAELRTFAGCVGTRSRAAARTAR